MQSLKLNLAGLLQHKIIVVTGILVCTILVVVLLPGSFARAGDFGVNSCNPDDLITAIDTANNTPGADIIHLCCGAVFLTGCGRVS